MLRRSRRRRPACSPEQASGAVRLPKGRQGRLRPTCSANALSVTSAPQVPQVHVSPHPVQPNHRFRRRRNALGRDRVDLLLVFAGKSTSFSIRVFGVCQRWVFGRRNVALSRAAGRRAVGRGGRAPDWDAVNRRGPGEG
jgi:hypothetical protein